MPALTKVKIVSLILIGITCALSITFYVVLTQIEKAQHKVLVAEDLVFKLFERRLLADEYLSFGSHRARDQWFIKNDNLINLVVADADTFTSIEDRNRLAEVALSLSESRAIFEEIVAQRESSTDSDVLLETKIDHLAVQLMLRSQAGLTAASRIAQSNTSHAANLLEVILVLFFVASLFVIPTMILGAQLVLRAVKSAEEIEEQKTKFLSMASHQLRTPLGSMRWNLEYIFSEDLSKLSRDVQERLASVFESNARLIILVGDLLNVTRIEAGRTKSEPIITDVGPILERALEEMSAEALRRGVVLQKDISQLPSTMVDPKRLREATQNLLSNAVKYTQKGGQVSLRANVVEDSVLVEVKDTGAGIPKADQGKVFTKFFRADNATRLDPEGNGLGLYIVKSFVEEWGGELTFVSEEGVGTTFTYTIPIKK